MIDIDEQILALDKQAKNLSVLDDVRLERELAKIHKRAQTLLNARGESDLEAYFAADNIVTRVRTLIAMHRRLCAGRRAS